MKRICPSCGSDDVRSCWGYRSPMGSECGICGYRAAIFPEMSAAAAKGFRKKSRKHAGPVGLPINMTERYVSMDTSLAVAGWIIVLMLAAFLLIIFFA